MSLQTVKNRIDSILVIKKITKAMELVATSKIEKNKNNFINSKEYLQLIIDNFWQQKKSFSDLINHNNLNISNKVWIVIGSDLGLCGGYNNNVLKLFKKNFSHGDKVIAIGKKIVNFMTSKEIETLYQSSVGFNEFGYDKIQTISDLLISDFLKGKISAINVIYTEYVNSLTFIAKTINIFDFNNNFVGQEEINHNIDYEPNYPTFIKKLLPFYFKAYLFSLINESKLSEVSSRRNSMENSTKNAQELIDNLTIFYNQIRQAQITQEISEIIAGAES